MLAASEPKLFVPFGRQHLLYCHAGCDEDDDTNCDKFKEEIHEMMQHLDLSESSLSLGSEKWRLRRNDNNVEEELYCYENKVVWSRGYCPSKRFPKKSANRELLKTFTTNYDVKHAIWCRFLCSLENSEESYSKQDSKLMDGVCVIDEKCLSIHVEGQECFQSLLPFQVASVWMVNNDTLILEREEAKNRQEYCEMLPRMYSLKDPLKDLAPVLMFRTGMLSYMAGKKLRVVYVNDHMGICMLYDLSTQLHSLWMFRPVSEEEMRELIPSDDESNAKQNQSFIFSAQNSTNPIDSRSTSFVPAYSSPVLNHSAGVPAASSSSLNFSKIPNSSTRSLSVANASTIASHRRQSYAPSPISNKTFKVASSHSVDVRLGCSPGMWQTTTPHPIAADLCLVYNWTEKLENKSYKMAECVFVSQDMSDRKYWCYITPASNKLHCVEISYVKEGECNVGTITTFPEVKCAIYVENSKTTAVMDLKSNISLMVGLVNIGQISFGGMSYSECLITNHTLPTSFSSGSRRSLLSSTKAVDAFSDDAAHQFSPVLPDISTIKGNNETTCEDSFQMLQSVRIVSGCYNDAIIEYDNSTCYRVTFPTWHTSMLVSDVINVLNYVLPTSISREFFLNWFRTRNAPGSLNISPQQEWQVFVPLFLRHLGYDMNKGPPLIKKEGSGALEVPRAKKKRASYAGMDSDWTLTCESDFFKRKFPELLSRVCPPKENDSAAAAMAAAEPKGRASKGKAAAASKGSASNSLVEYEISANGTLYPFFHRLIFGLHAVYEEYKLDIINAEDSRQNLAELLYQMTWDAGMAGFAAHYARDFPIMFRKPGKLTDKVRGITPDQIAGTSKRELQAPDIFIRLHGIIRKRRDIPPYPFYWNINDVSQKLIHFFAVMYPSKFVYDDYVAFVAPGNEENPVSYDNISELQLNFFKSYMSLPPSYSIMEKVLSLLPKYGFNERRIWNLPVGIRWNFMAAVHSCRDDPPLDWGREEYALVFREDIAVQFKPVEKCPMIIVNSAMVYPETYLDGRSVDEYDGMSEVTSDKIMKMLWPMDRRVEELRLMLQTANPIVLEVGPQSRPELSISELMEEQEKRLVAAVQRTLSAPIGRGMFTLRSDVPNITEPVAIPKLQLSGKTTTGVVVDYSNIETAPHMNSWALFHNGVAAGLKVTNRAIVTDASWILLNRPKVANPMNEDLPEHAGFLLGLGLNGHLVTLQKLITFDYLSRFHEMTSIAVILGLAACKRGTMDLSATKLISVHVESMLPPTSLELDIDHSVQVAAIMGLGLLYQETMNRHIVEVLLLEMGRPPGPEMENSLDRESYTLATGFALGLVLLGKGDSLVTGMSDVKLADTLHYYMVGGQKRPLTGCRAQREKYKCPSYQVQEGKIVNVTITSPAATVALGLIYFDTCNETVANWMKVPETPYMLDMDMPDFILLKTLARSLIMWKCIKPTKVWVDEQIPSMIRACCFVSDKSNEKTENMDLEAINQIYVHIVAGACFSLGLRYAGSANQQALNTLFYYCRQLMAVLTKLYIKNSLQSCLNVVVTAMALVMSGTGDVSVMRICRFLRRRTAKCGEAGAYGTHMAINMSLGTLFLGGGSYSLCTTPESVAALLISFYPKYPLFVHDNRYHLQAFRHLYVLAAEPRLVAVFDLDNHKWISALLVAEYEDDDQEEFRDKKTKLYIKTPCLMPELKYLRTVSFCDKRYWPITFIKGQRSWQYFEETLKYESNFELKARSGFLSYEDDQVDCRLLSKTSLTTLQHVPWKVSEDASCYMTSDEATKKMIEMYMKYVKKEYIWEKRISQAMDYFRRIIHECIRQDKGYLLPLWIKTLKIINSMEEYPCSDGIWQLIFFVEVTMYSSHHFKPENARYDFVTPEISSNVEYSLNCAMKCWEKNPDYKSIAEYFSAILNYSR